MAVLPIVKIPDPILRERAAPVERFDPALRALVQNMAETMEAAKGVGIAAPQVGEGLRLFVARVRKSDPRLPEGDPLAGKLLVLVNPVLAHAGEQMEEGPEACLSIPDYGGYVPRHTEIIVQGRNEWGKAVKYAVSGFMARVMQHELDHLDGVLFLDRLTGEDKLYRLEPRGEESTRSDDADTTVHGLREEPLEA